LWICSFYLLPIMYLLTANDQKERLNIHPDTTYYFHFSYVTKFLPLYMIIVGLASILIVDERRTQTMEFLFSMPFKRGTIYLSKWVFGIIHITGITIINFTLMFIIQKVTIHKEYQTITPFLLFFL